MAMNASRRPHDSRALRRVVFGCALIVPLMLPGAAPAQNAAPGAGPAVDKSQALDQLKARDQELVAAREKQRQSAEAEATLKREIEELSADRRKLAQDLIDTAARTRDTEAKIEATQQRLEPLAAREVLVRQSIDERRAVIGEVLAALQRIGRRPPPALIASPEDALQAVRTAMVLGAVLPDMRGKVDALAADLSELLNLRKNITTESERLRPRSPRSKRTGSALPRSPRSARSSRASASRRSRPSAPRQLNSPARPAISRI